MTSHRYLIRIALFIIVALVYFGTLTYWHTGDDIQWIMRIEKAVTARVDLHPASPNGFASPPPDHLEVSVKPLNPTPRYLLEGPTSSLVYRASRSLGWGGNAVRPVQYSHSILGAIGVFFFFLSMEQLLKDWRWAFAFSLGLAFSYSWWHYSTHLDFTIAAHVLASISFYLYLRLLQSSAQSWRRCIGLSVLLGVVNALSALYLVAELVIVPALVVSLLVHHNARGQQKKILSLLGSYVLATLFTIGVVFVCVYIVMRGTVPWVELSWTQLMRNTINAGIYAHDFSLTDVPRSAYGLVKALATYPGLNLQDPHTFIAGASLAGIAMFAGFYMLTAVVAFLPFALLLWFRKELTRHIAIVGYLLIWFLGNMLFVIYYEPSYIKWWTGALIPWWGLIGVLVAVFISRSKTPNKLLFAVPGLVILLFAINFLFQFLPASRPNSNPWPAISQALSDQTSLADLFVSPGAQHLDHYLPYFANRRVVAYALMYLTYGRNEGSINRLMNDAIQSTLDEGGRVFVYGWDEQSIRDWQMFLSLGVQPYINPQRATLKEAWSFDTVTIYEVIDFDP